METFDFKNNESCLFLSRPKDSLEARVWRNVKVVRLAERQGFGFAVKARLPDSDRASEGLNTCAKDV